LADKTSDALRAAPAPVAAAVVKLVGDNKISEFDAESEGGKMVYDLEYTIKGVTYEADIDPAGNILQREIDVDLSFLPAAVIAAANKAHAGGTLHEASVLTTGDKLCYSVDVKVGADTHEMQIGADGAVLKDSIEAPEEEEEAPAAKTGAATKPADKTAKTAEKDDED